MKYSRDILEQSFLIISKNPDKFTNHFYDTVLRENKELEHIFRNSDLKLQKAEFVKGFLIIYTNLDNVKYLEEFLFDLGIRHVTYEVIDEHYPLIEHALMDSLKFIHGDSWNNELLLEWGKFISFITTHMQSGSRFAQAA